MESIIKVFLGIYMILMVTFSSTGIIATSITQKNANSFLSDTINCIENTNLNSDTISTFNTEYSSANYRDTIERIEEKRNGNIYNPYIIVITPTDIDGDGIFDTAKVELTYDLCVPFLNTGSHRQTIVGYAQ